MRRSFNLAEVENRVFQVLGTGRGSAVAEITFLQRWRRSMQSEVFSAEVVELAFRSIPGLCRRVAGSLLEFNMASA
jgi:hypothetical protein